MPETVKFIRELHSLFHFSDNDLHFEHGVALKTIPWNTGETSQLFSFQAQYLYFFSIFVCGYYIHLFQYSLSEISV